MQGVASGCRDFEADLSALLDGELAPERAAELRVHVAACDGCRGRLAGLARVDAALAGAPAPALPASLRARLEARLASARPEDTQLRRTRRVHAPRRAWRGRTAGALAAAAAGVALYLAVATREPVRQSVAPSPEQIARPRVEAPHAAPQQVAQHPAPARTLPAPLPAKAPAEPPLDLASVPEEDLGLALEIDTVEDLDVIANLELLELVLAAEAS